MQITFSTSNDQLDGIGQGPPPPSQGGPRANLDNLAKTLGVSTDDLETARKNGQSLSDFATSKGISRDKLVNAVKADMAAGKPADAPELSDDQLTAMATSMIDRKPGQGGPRGAQGVQGAQAAQGGMSLTVQLPDSTVLDALRSAVSSSSDDANAGFKQFLQQLAQSSTGSGSLGVNALA